MPKKKKIYTNEDFENASRIDKMQMSLTQPDDFNLNNDDWDYMQILTQAYPIVCRNLSKQTTLALISELSGVWPARAVKIFNDCQELYGRFEDVNSVVLRAIMTEKYRFISEEVEKIANKKDVDETAVAKLFEVSRRCVDSIVKINRLDRDETEAFDAEIPNFTIGIHEGYLKGLSRLAEEGEVVDE
jgi:hypothetical protein